MSQQMKFNADQNDLKLRMYLNKSQNLFKIQGGCTSSHAHTVTAIFDGICLD